MNKVKDKWNDGDPYEYFMGRWSKLMASEFLSWLNMPSLSSCLEIGCGTGALSEAIYKYSEPKQFCSIDPSEGFINKAKERLQGKGEFIVGNVSELPFENNVFDIIVSGITLNFFPDLEGALAEMKRVSKPKGVIAAYVWDYADRMDFLRLFWDAAYQINPDSHKLDEGIRFPICNTDNLRSAFLEAGLSDIETTYLDINTIFRNFEDYWNPFLGGQGPAPSYLASLNEDLQEKLKNNIHRKLVIKSDGSIKLLARAIAIRGIYT